MRRLAIIGVLALALVGGTAHLEKTPLAPVAALIAPEEASAHGRHASFIQPDWDCYKATRGDLAVIHDRDRNRYIKWRCVCVQTARGLYCYWKIISVVQALSAMRIPSATAAYFTATICPKRVKWMAWHGGSRVLHIRSRFWLIHVRHK